MTSQWQIVWLLAVLAMILVFVQLTLVATQWYWLGVRSHNLDVFYRSLTCGDLPLSEDTNETACREAIGQFMVPERGLFTR